MSSTTHMVSALLLALVSFSFDTASAQTVASGGSDLDLQKIYPFGDGHTTRKMAQMLLKEEGLSYIAHYACRGTDCSSAPQKRVASGQRRGKPPTMFELTGFDERLGAMTVTLADVSCGSRIQDAITHRNTTRRPNCFAGFRLLQRIFHDVVYETAAEAYIFAHFQRIQVPGRGPDPEAQGNGLWHDVGTYELRKTVTGEVSSGRRTETIARFTLPDGTVAAEETDLSLTIASSTGDDGVDVPDDLDISVDTETGEIRRAISSATEKSELCTKEANAKANVEGQKSTVLAIAVELIAKAMTLGIKSITFGTGDLPGGNVTIEPPVTAEQLQRNEQAAKGAVEGQAYLDCMAREEPGLANPNPSAIHQMLDNGTVDLTQDVSGWSVPLESGACDNVTKTYHFLENGQNCTRTVKRTCDMDCNCKTEDNTVCTDL